MNLKPCQAAFHTLLIVENNVLQVSDCGLWQLKITFGTFLCVWGPIATSISTWAFTHALKISSIFSFKDEMAIPIVNVLSLSSRISKRVEFWHRELKSPQQTQLKITFNLEQLSTVLSSAHSELASSIMVNEWFASNFTWLYLPKFVNTPLSKVVEWTWSIECVVVATEQPPNALSNQSKLRPKAVWGCQPDQTNEWPTRPTLLYPSVSAARAVLIAVICSSSGEASRLIWYVAYSGVCVCVCRRIRATRR